MGTIAQRFESGQQKANEGHFKNLVMLARVNGKVEESEKQLLARIAKRLSLTAEQVNEILDNPDNYPMIPPSSLEERIEQEVVGEKRAVETASAPAVVVLPREPHEHCKRGARRGVDCECPAEISEARVAAVGG